MENGDGLRQHAPLMIPVSALLQAQHVRDDALIRMTNVSGTRKSVSNVLVPRRDPSGPEVFDRPVELELEGSESGQGLRRAYRPA